MFNPILVPLDGSQLAECVLPHVSAMARPFGAEVTLLRILEKDQTDGSQQFFDLLNWQISKTKAGHYLETIEARLHTSGIETKTIILEGLVAESIAEYTQNQGMKLIVLSSHGRHGLTHWGISSITQKIILSAQTSLLIVRAERQYTQADEESENPLYQRILVPLDGSQRAENVLPIITHLSHFHKSQIHLVQVVQTPEIVRQMPLAREDIELSNQVVARNREEAAHYLDQLKSRSDLEGSVVQTHLITSDNAAVALHQLEEQEHIDMVILNAHGYSGNHQWPYGSMAHNFILYSKAHLLIVQDRPAKQEATHPEFSSKERAEH